MFTEKINTWFREIYVQTERDTHTQTRFNKMKYWISMGNRIAFISVRRIFPDVSFCFIQCPFIVSSPFSTLSHKNSTLWYACAKNGRTHTPYREKKRKLTQNKVYLLFNCHLSIAKRRMKKNPNRITFVFVKILILEFFFHSSSVQFFLYNCPNEWNEMERLARVVVAAKRHWTGKTGGIFKIDDIRMKRRISCDREIFDVKNYLRNGLQANRECEWAAFRIE